LLASGRIQDTEPFDDIGIEPPPTMRERARVTEYRDAFGD
jgi:hypothetical protein